MNGLLNLAYPLLDAFDGSLSFLSAALRIVLLGAVSGGMAMGLYVLFSNQARLRACKEEIRAIRVALGAAKDDFSETMRLSRRNLAASFKLLGVTLGPALLSSLPLLAIIGWLAAHYGYTVPAAGTPVPVAFLPGADGIAVEPPDALQGGAETRTLRWPAEGASPRFVDAAGPVYEGPPADLPATTVHKSCGGIGCSATRRATCAPMPPSTRSPSRSHPGSWSRACRPGSAAGRRSISSRCWRPRSRSRSASRSSRQAMSKQDQPAPGAMGASGGMEMPRWLDALGSFIDRTAGFWQKLGDLESSSHRAELDAIPIDRPIYVAGLARSGSTILLELLAGRPQVATHRYRDFPPIFTPLFWNRAFAHVYRTGAPPAERAHKDRILVTPDSPEAMEEVLWMRFFKGAHDTGQSQVLDRGTSNPAFERFYTDHLKKILLVRGGRRYLSKGNYNLTRFAYLQKLFPTARFIVPVREPRWHIASLIKQHRLFCAEETRDPRILKHMQRAGHLEFGLDRRAVNTGDTAAAAEIERLWRDGEEVRGWARLWAMLYGFVLAQRQADPALGQAVHLVRYEDLCDRPQETLAAAFAHAELPLAPAEAEAMAGRLSQPTYYDPGFTRRGGDGDRRGDQGGSGAAGLRLKSGRVG